MKRVAVFCEGQSELIFVREYLLRWYSWGIDLRCANLLSDDKGPTSAEYDIDNPTADLQFSIFNCGSDAAVLTRMLRREDRLWNAGFTRIVGLRDMFSKEYRQLSGGAGIMQELNAKFIEGFNQRIQRESKHSDHIRFCFAIMEIEAWMLGMIDALDRRLDGKALELAQDAGIALGDADPETTYFHPAEVLKDLMRRNGEDADPKSAHMVNAFMGHCQREDFEQLLTSGHCPSFGVFHDALTNLD